MASTGPSAAASAVPPPAPSGAAPLPAPYGAAPPPYGAAATYGASGVAPPAHPDLPHGSAPLPPLAYVAAPPPALSGQSVVAPPPAPTLPVDPLLSRGAFDAPVPTYGAPPVYGSPGYWWGSSAGQHSSAGEYPPPLPSGGYGLPMASPFPSPALPPAPWDPVLLPALHAAPTPNNYTGGDDWYMDTGATAHMFAHPGRSNQDGTSPM